jgi:hypothetical protein
MRYAACCVLRAACCFVANCDFAPRLFLFGCADCCEALAFGFFCFTLFANCDVAVS